MKESYEHSKLVSNLLRAVALILSTMMCIVNFIACSAGNRDTINSSNNDVNNEVSNTNEAGYDSWESVLDAFLTAVENGDSNAISSLIAPLIVDKMKSDPENYSGYEDEFEWCTGVSKAEFKSFKLSSFKIYNSQLLSTENIYDMLYDMLADSESDVYSGLEDAIYICLLIDFEYCGVRIDFHDEYIEGDDYVEDAKYCDEEFCFVKQNGKWYLYEGGGKLFFLIDQINDYRSGG